MVSDLTKKRLGIILHNETFDKDCRGLRGSLVGMNSNIIKGE